MTKMVPASRLVTEASLEPPSSPRRRAITPAGGAVADCVSITATRLHPVKRAARRRRCLGCINHSLRFGWVGPSFLRTQEPVATGSHWAKGFGDHAMIDGSRG